MPTDDGFVRCPLWSVQLVTLEKGNEQQRTSGSAAGLKQRNRKSFAYLTDISSRIRNINLDRSGPTGNTMLDARCVQYGPRDRGARWLNF